MFAEFVAYCFDYRFKAQKIMLYGTKYLVVNRKDLPTGIGLVYVLASCVFYLTFALIVLAVFGSLVNILRITLGADFSWTVFLWWGGAFALLNGHAAFIRVWRWYIAGSKDVLKGALSTGISNGFSAAILGEALPIWDKDKRVKQDA